MRTGAWLILVIAVTFAGFVFYSLATVQPVKVMSSHLDRNAEGVLVIGKVRNTSDHPITTDLEVHYYGRDGRPLGQDKLVIDRLQAGAVRDFRSTRRPLSGVDDFSIYLNNGRNPYGN